MTTARRFPSRPLHSLGLALLFACSSSSEVPDGALPDAGASDSSLPDVALDAPPPSEWPSCSEGEVVFREGSGPRYATSAAGIEVHEGAFHNLRGFEHESITPDGALVPVGVVGDQGGPRLISTGSDLLLVTSLWNETPQRLTVRSVVNLYGPSWDVDTVLRDSAFSGGSLFLLSEAADSPPAFEVYDVDGGLVRERTLVNVEDIGGFERWGLSLESGPDGAVLSLLGQDRRSIWAGPVDGRLAGLTSGECDGEGDSIAAFEVLPLNDGTLLWARACSRQGNVVLGSSADPSLRIVLSDAATSTQAGISLRSGPGNTIVAAVGNSSEGRVYVTVIDASSFVPVGSGDFEPETAATLTLVELSREHIDGTFGLRVVDNGYFPEEQLLLGRVCPR